MFVLAHAKRRPKIGIPLYQIQNSIDLEPKINILERKDVDQATELIRKQIEQVNKRLTKEEKNVLIRNAVEEDPDGYDCENQVLEIKEISFVDQVRCYNTTEEVCSKVRFDQFQKYFNFAHLFYA